MVKVKSDGQGHVEYRTAAGTFGLKQELKTKAKSEKKLFRKPADRAARIFVQLLKIIKKAWERKREKTEILKNILKF